MGVDNITAVESSPDCVKETFETNPRGSPAKHVDCNSATGAKPGRNIYQWSCPERPGLGPAVPRRYRFPTLGADRLSFALARADPLACNLNNDMVLLWNEVVIEDQQREQKQRVEQLNSKPENMSGEENLVTDEVESCGRPASEESSIEDAYQRLFATAVKHREELHAILRDAGMEEIDLGVENDDDTSCMSLACDEAKAQDELRVGEDIISPRSPSARYSPCESTALLSNTEDGILVQRDEVERNVGAEEVHLLADDVNQEREEDPENNGIGFHAGIGFDDSGVIAGWQAGEEFQQDITGEEVVIMDLDLIADGDNSPFRGDTCCPSAYGNEIKLHNIDVTRGDDECCHHSPTRSVQLDKATPPFVSDNTFLHTRNTSDIPQQDSSRSSHDLDLLECERSSHDLSPGGHKERSATWLEDCHQEQYIEVCDQDILPTVSQEQRLDPSPDTVQERLEQGNHACLQTDASSNPFQPSDKVGQHIDITYPDFINYESGSPFPLPVYEAPKLSVPSQPHTNQQENPSPIVSKCQSPLVLYTDLKFPNHSPDNMSPNWNQLPSHPIHASSPYHLPTSPPYSPLTPHLGSSPVPSPPETVPLISAETATPTQQPVITCRSPGCHLTTPLSVARHSYKNCHNCRWAYYCCRECRRRDWERHKSTECHASRVSSTCKRVLHFCSRDVKVKTALSRLARRGFLSSGRGCVLLGFPDLSAAETFLSHGLVFKQNNKASRVQGLEFMPVYVSLKELEVSKMYGGGEMVQKLVRHCQNYNPSLKFLLNVGIGIKWNRVPRSDVAEHSANPVNKPCSLDFLDSRYQMSEDISNISLSRSYIEPDTFTPSLNSMQSPKNFSTSSALHTTVDSAYDSMIRSPKSPKSPKNQRRHEFASRARSASMGSEDIGYGSLGDLRESLSESQVFHVDDVFPESPSFNSSTKPLLSPRIAFDDTEAVVHYPDAGPHGRCPILQKCASLRLNVPVPEAVPPSLYHSISPLSSSPVSDTPLSSHKFSLSSVSKAGISQGSLNLSWKSRRCRRRPRCLGGSTLILTGVPGSWYEAQDEVRLRASQARRAHSMETSRTSTDIDTGNGIKIGHTSQDVYTNSTGKVKGVENVNAVDAASAYCNDRTDRMLTDTFVGKDEFAIELKHRELTFASIQRRLRQRGVDLKQQFPEIYAELVDFVSGAISRFPSRVIFPVSRHGTGRRFTCLLMPEAEPDLKWTRSSNLLRNLDISKEDTFSPFLPGKFQYGSIAATREGMRVHSSVNDDRGKDSDSVSRTLQSQTWPALEGTRLHADTTRSQPELLNSTDGRSEDLESRLHRLISDQWQEEGNNDQSMSRLCSRCLKRLPSVHQSTQTGMSTINTVKRKLTIPDLISHCPTSSHARRKVNTNFPIFSFPPHILDVFSTLAAAYPDSLLSQETMTPMLLGHMACTSILLKYRQHKLDVSTSPAHSGQSTSTEVTKECHGYEQKCPFSTNPSERNVSFCSTAKQTNEKEENIIVDDRPSPPHEEKHTHPVHLCHGLEVTNVDNGWAHSYPESGESGVKETCDYFEFTAQLTDNHKSNIKNLPSKDLVEQIMWQWKEDENKVLIGNDFHAGEISEQMSISAHTPSLHTEAAGDRVSHLSSLSTEEPQPSTEDSSCGNPSSHALIRDKEKKHLWYNRKRHTNPHLHPSNQQRQHQVLQSDW